MIRCKIVQSNRVLDQDTTKYPVNDENDLAEKASLKLFHIPPVEHMALTGTLTQITARRAKSCVGDVMMISLTSK